MERLRGGRVAFLRGYFILPYFFNIRITDSCGSAGTVLPLMPVVVFAATKALIMASSVACTVAVNSMGNQAGGLFRSQTLYWIGERRLDGFVADRQPGNA